jgi:hypothetical protein
MTLTYFMRIPNLMVSMNRDLSATFDGAPTHVVNYVYKDAARNVPAPNNSSPKKFESAQTNRPNRLLACANRFCTDILTSSLDS